MKVKKIIFLVLAVAVGIYGFLDVYRATEGFVRIYGGRLSFIVGHKPYSSAILAGVIWLVIFIVFLIIALVGGKKNRSRGVAATPTQAYKSYEKRIAELKETDVVIDEATEAKLFAISFQELLLVAPASAKFAPLEEISCVAENDVYIVSGYVDSQNSYGAMIRTPFSLKVKKTNGMWQSFAVNALSGKTIGIAIMIASAVFDTAAMVLIESDMFTPMLIGGSVVFMIGLLITILSRK